LPFGIAFEIEALAWRGDETPSASPYAGMDPIVYRRFAASVAAVFDHRRAGTCPAE
jgi:hypothetical protein